MAIKRYLCPFCNKRIDKEKLVSHLSHAHANELPEDFSASRAAFHIINKRPLEYRRKCRICGAPTSWDEKKCRYNFLCGKPACDKAWVEKMKSTMGDKMGSNRPTATTEGLEKMLAGRKISGKYKFKDGHEYTYTGSYELEVLKFLDQVLEVKSEDLAVPGPVLNYQFQGKTHMYITDMYYIPYNLIIEVKDGGSNPNTNKQYAVTRAKQMAKENYVIKNTDYNYLRLTDKDLSQLFTVFAELKLNMEENDRIVRVHEAVDDNSDRALDTIIFDFGNVLVYDKDPMVHTKDNLEVCFFTDRLLSTLKEKGYKLYYLSNWDEESFAYQVDKGVMDFMKYFDGGIVSYETEAEKPAVSIYKKLIDKYQIDTQRAIFLDDNQKNIECAREEGLTGIVFDKPFVNILMELPSVKKKEVVKEGAIVNDKDIYYNKAKFDAGEINVCFITGLSGSGKSTLANKMEKNGIEKYELDDVLANYNFTDENLKEYGDLISGFFKGTGKKYRIQPDEKEKAKDWTDEIEASCIRSFVDHVTGYARSHKASKFIIEGVELYWFYKPEELKDYAVYIKGTSALVSMIRSARRDASDVKGLSRMPAFLKNMFRKDRAHAYFQTESTIQKWRDYFVSVSDSTIHENMYAASQGFMLMNPNDSIIINYMKHNTFTDEGDYALAFNQKFDRIFARDEHGILKEFTTSFLLDATYTPYIVDDNANFVKEFIENRIDTKVSSSEIYEAAFDHPLYSKDQILFEARAKKYKDYYKMLQDTDEYIAKNTQPSAELICPIGEVYLNPPSDMTPVTEEGITMEVTFDNISEPWFVTSDDGAVNCCISVPGYEHCMRGRSSMLILKKEDTWKVFIRKAGDSYNAPGGGWDKGETPMDAAIREAREEVRIEVSNVRRMGTLIEYDNFVLDWVKEHVKDEKDWWYGYYSAVFVGLYAGEYTGEVKEMDRDSIGYEGDWYDIEDAAKGMAKEYNVAIKRYIEEEDRVDG